MDRISLYSVCNTLPGGSFSSMEEGGEYPAHRKVLNIGRSVCDEGKGHRVLVHMVFQVWVSES